MNSDYKIVKFTPKYITEITKLYALAYNRKKPSRYFIYRLNKNPYGYPISFLMKFNKKIVGFYSIQPLILSIKNRNVLGGYSFLTMTHPEHAGKGIFTKLASKTYQEAHKKGYKFVIGFANKNSRPGFLKKLGFMELHPINHISIKIKDKKIPFELKDKIDIKNIPNNVSKLWSSYLSKDEFQIKIDRGYKFISWRYSKNPIAKYDVFFKNNDYLIIFKKYGTVLHIIDFMGVENEEFYRNIISTANHLANKYKCKEITFWIPKKHQLMKYLFSKNMKHLRTKSFFIIRALDKKLFPVLSKLDNWYYTMGDADVF